MLAPKTTGMETASGKIASQNVASRLPGPLIPSGNDETANRTVKASTGAALAKLPAKTDLPNAHIAIDEARALPHRNVRFWRARKTSSAAAIGSVTDRQLS